MDPLLETNKVTDQCKLSPFSFPEVSEICEQELSSSYENYQESVFRSLTTNFDNNYNISTVNEAFDNLEKCFIANNVLSKHGTSKFKASPSSKLLLNYRDIEDAFADLLISENASKRLDGNETVKKIDLKRFKDIFPIKLYDIPLSDNDDSQSNSEGIEDSESLLESFMSENDASDHDEADNEVANVDISFTTEFPIDSTHSCEKSEAEPKVRTNVMNNSASPLNNIVRDVRIVVEKLPKDNVNGEDDNSRISLTESYNRTWVKEKRQVARKRTGGMVSNAINDVNINKEQKEIHQLSNKDGEFVPSVFDKMTRAGKRDLERVLAESTANLVIQKTSQLITEKIKELRPYNQSDSGSSDDENAQSDIHKTAEIVTNTIIEFLTKSKCKKLEKLGKDISDEISNKLNHLKFGNEIGISTPELEENQIQTTSKSNSVAEIKVEKMENKAVTLGCDKLEDDNSMKRITRETVRKKNAIALEEMARNESDMLESTILLVDRGSEVCEPRRPETRQSKQKLEDDTKSMPNNETFREEPRRPETRQSKQKLDEETKNLPEKDLVHDDQRRLTRLSKQKQEDDVKNTLHKDDDDGQDAPRRPETRQSKQKQADVKNILVRDSINDESRRETRLSKLKQDDMTELTVPKVAVKPTVKAKRKKAASKSKRRRDSNKLSGKIISGEEAVDPLATEQLIDGQFLIDTEIRERSPLCDSNSSNRALKDLSEFPSTASPPFAGGTILKASADSTTLDGNLINDDRNIDDIRCLHESNSDEPGAVMHRKEKTVHHNRDYGESLELSCSDAASINAKNKTKDEEVQCHSSQDVSHSPYSTAFDNLAHNGGPKQSNEHISNVVDSTNNKLDNDINRVLSNERENELVENKENLGLVVASKQSNTSHEDGITKQKPNEVIRANENKDSKENHDTLSPICIPSQLLNDIITDIEKSTENSSDSRNFQDIVKVPAEENAESLADSTSFLNYTLDDSFKLVVDESILPTKEFEEQPHNEVSSEVNANIDVKVDKTKQEGEQDEKSNLKEEEKDTALGPENKVVSGTKPLTIEEKIARITNRDPRLVNDKKVVNVSIRDPRLRNKLPKVEESQEKLIQPKISQPSTSDNLQSSDPCSDNAPMRVKEPAIDEKKTLVHSDAKTTDPPETDVCRKKKLKKEIDEELLYKTPLSDLHASTSADRPTYIRSIKPKRQVHPVRKDKDLNEDSKPVGQRLNRAFDESIEERRNEENIGVYKPEPYPLEDNPQVRFFNRGPSFNESNFRLPYNEEINHRLEEPEYGSNCDDRRDLPLRQDYQSGSRQIYEYARRTTTNSERRDLPDNQFYSRREFYRRNKYSHDHDHFSNSNRFMETREEMPPFFPQNVHSEDFLFRASAYPPVSLLPDPMYSQEEDFDQSFTNMDTDSFSPPSSEMCPPPPPQIRPPTPDRLRRESFCPSPPRIGRASPDRDYEPYNRPFQRNYDREERSSSRGSRNSFPRENLNTRTFRGGGGSYKRGGNGRDYRRNEESPPRKRFITEPREDDRGHWRRSPSWSPDRSRRWSSDRSLSPCDQQWDRSPPEVRPWESPPSSAPGRRSDHYRERSQSYKNYRRY